MDYDYYDESRTRFQLQSSPLVAEEEDKKRIDLFEVGFCVFLALLSLGFAWYSQGILQFSLIWLASALLVGPFAPSSATGGACNVGVGELLPPEKAEEGADPSETEVSSSHNFKQRRKVLSLPSEEPLSRKERGNADKQVPPHEGENGNLPNVEDGNGDDDAGSEGSSGVDDGMYDYDSNAHQKKDVRNASSAQSDQYSTIARKGDVEWTPTDIDLLKKLMVRYPRGMLKRWEVIAESFDGSHSVESIVKMSKTMGLKNKVSSDSYSEFLEKRKGQANVITSPLSQRWDVDDAQLNDSKNTEGDEKTMHQEDDIAKTVGGSEIQGQGRKKSEWTEGEDKSLLSALKTFPKDTPMRWEKVALAVPTRTKQQCFRRYSQLKESFRNKLEKS